MLGVSVSLAEVKPCIFGLLDHSNPAEDFPEIFDYASSSPIPIDEDATPPRQMTDSDIRLCIQDYTNAATNIIPARLYGVETHAAIGCFIDQVIQA